MPSWTTAKATSSSSFLLDFYSFILSFSRIGHLFPHRFWYLLVWTVYGRLLQFFVAKICLHTFPTASQRILRLGRHAHRARCLCEYGSDDVHPSDDDAKWYHVEEAQNFISRGANALSFKWVNKWNDIKPWYTCDVHHFATTTEGLDTTQAAGGWPNWGFFIIFSHFQSLLIISKLIFILKQHNY